MSARGDLHDRSTSTQIIADIAGAEQASGVDEVNNAIMQMDNVTQQNSALVEENAATAKALEHQAPKAGTAPGASLETPPLLRLRQPGHSVVRRRSAM